jgi:hypothetical protein
MVAHAFNPSRGRRISEFEASLVYKVSSRTASVTQRNPVSKTPKKKNRKKGLGINSDVFVCQLDASWSYYRERNLQGNASMNPAVRHFLSQGGRAQPIVGGTIPGLVVLGSIRNQAEQARGSKPVSSIPPWPLHQLLLPGSCPV